MKIASRKDIIEYAKAVDDDFRTENNVTYARKVFMVNAVIQWCINQVNSQKIHPNEMDFYLQAVSAFVRGECDIYWDEDCNLVIS